MMCACVLFDAGVCGCVCSFVYVGGVLFGVGSKAKGL